MVLFFMMVTFLFLVVLLVYLGKWYEKSWKAMEEAILRPQATKNRQYLSAKAELDPCPRFGGASRARFEQFEAQRARFIAQLSSARRKPLPHDFAYSEYLSLHMEKELEEIIEVTQASSTTSQSCASGSR